MFSYSISIAADIIAIAVAIVILVIVVPAAIAIDVVTSAIADNSVVPEIFPINATTVTSAGGSESNCWPEFVTERRLGKPDRDWPPLGLVA